MPIQERNKNMGSFPSYPDPTGAGYSTFAPNPGTYSAFTGTAKDPFVNGDQGRDHRGDYPFYLSPQNFATNAPNTQTAFFVSCEPLLIQSLFSQTSTSKAGGFYNVESMSFQISLANPMNIWSHDVTRMPYTAQTSGFYGAPVMLIEYWVPADKSVPRAPLEYSVSQITQYPQITTPLIPSGSTFTVTYNNIQSSSIPNSIYLFCRPTPGQSISTNVGELSGTITAMDNYAGIAIVPFNSLTGPSPNIGIMQVTFNTVSSQLSGMTAIQLYNMCVENGLENTSFADWSEFGAVFKLYFGKDIYITDQDTVAGSRGSYNTVIQCNFQNNFSRALTFDPQLIMIQDGYFTIGSESNQVTVGAITKNEVREANPIVERSVAGGGLFGIIGKAASYVPWGTVGNVVDTITGLGTHVGGAMEYEPAKCPIADGGGYTLH